MKKSNLSLIETQEAKRIEKKRIPIRNGRIGPIMLMLVGVIGVWCTVAADILIAGIIPALSFIAGLVHLSTEKTDNRDYTLANNQKSVHIVNNVHIS